MFTGVGELIIILVTALVLVAVLPFWAWMLKDCIANEPPGSRRRMVWFALFFTLGPVGAAAYFLLRRRPRVASSATRHRSR